MMHLTEILAVNGMNPALAYLQGHFKQTSYGRIYIPPQISADEQEKEARSCDDLNNSN